MGVEDDKATETVLAVLQDQSINKIRFKLNRREISPSLYQQVAKAIKDKKITVLVQPSLLASGESGRYYPEIKVDKDTEFYDVRVLRSSTLGANASEKFNAAQVIIHECTHAGFDLLKLAKMTHAEHEAASYIAGAIFSIENMLAMKGDPAKVIFKEALEQAAWKIGILEAKDQAVPKELYAALDAAIRAHPGYKHHADHIAKNDGVGREWKLK
jgi:hypothetical protein